VRQKDPKKVAAGRAGAAARKAKQDRLLAELRQAKASVCEQAPPEDTPIQAEKRHDVERRHSNPDDRHNMMPWIVGAFGFTGLAILWQWRSQQFTPSDRNQPLKATAPFPQKETRKHLKPCPDPFHME
jgi:hypothetical protein